MVPVTAYPNLISSSLDAVPAQHDAAGLDHLLGAAAEDRLEIVEIALAG